MLESWLTAEEHLLAAFTDNPIPSGGSQPSVTLIPEDPVPSSDLCGCCMLVEHIGMVDRGILDSDDDCSPDWAEVMYQESCQTGIGTDNAIRKPATHIQVV